MGAKDMIDSYINYWRDRYINSGFRKVMDRRTRFGWCTADVLAEIQALIKFGDAAWSSGCISKKVYKFWHNPGESILTDAYIKYDSKEAESYIKDANGVKNLYLAGTHEIEFSDKNWALLAGLFEGQYLNCMVTAMLLVSQVLNNRGCSARFYFILNLEGYNELHYEVSRSALYERQPEDIQFFLDTVEPPYTRHFISMKALNDVTNGGAIRNSNAKIVKPLEHIATFSLPGKGMTGKFQLYRDQAHNHIFRQVSATDSRHYVDHKFRDYSDFKEYVKSRLDKYVEDSEKAFNRLMAGESF